MRWDLVVRGWEGEEKSKDGCRKRFGGERELGGWDVIGWEKWMGKAGQAE